MHMAIAIHTTAVSKKPVLQWRSHSALWHGKKGRTMNKVLRLIFTFSLFVGLIIAIAQANTATLRPEGISRGDQAIVAAIFVVGFAIFLGTEREQ